MNILEREIKKKGENVDNKVSQCKKMIDVCKFFLYIYYYLNKSRQNPFDYYYAVKNISITM